MSRAVPKNCYQKSCLVIYTDSNMSQENVSMCLFVGFMVLSLNQLQISVLGFIASFNMLATSNTEGDPSR